MAARTLRGFPSYCRLVIGEGLRIYLSTWANTARVCAPTVLEDLFGRVTREKCSRRLEEWSKIAVEEAAIDLDVRGGEHIQPDDTYVVMSNHQSNYDIFVLFHAFPGVMRMVAKKELFRVPLLGSALRASEFIEMDRADPEKARQALRQARALLETGIHVWIAPEGTRSASGELLPFKKGGFMLALRARAKILPVTLDGTYAVQPAGSPCVRPGKRVTVTFHPVLDTRDYRAKGTERLISDVRSSIASALPPSQRAADNHGSFRSCANDLSQRGRSVLTS